MPSSVKPANRCRAGAACGHCHARKSKCDAQEKGTPCSSCVQRGMTDCALLPTARGKYIRKPKIRLGKKPETTHRRKTSKISPEESSASSTSSSSAGGQISSHGAHIHHDPNKPLAPGSEQYSYLTPNASQFSAFSADAVMFEDAQNIDPALRDSSSGSSHNPDESSWVDLFEAFLKSGSGEVEIDKACITYLGESFPLTTVLEDFRSGAPLKLHHPGPPLLAPSPTTSAGGIHPPHLGKAEVAYLESKGVFEFPPDPLFDELMNAFAVNFYPLYPAVILQDFIAQWKSRSLPWMLCHAVCFAGAAFCPRNVLHAAGFQSRREALNGFYVKTKLLFDFGYERDKIILLQSVTLLTFWPSSPNDLWTFYHWISFGVTLAESLGMHRSLTQLNLAQKDRSLLKRLWWILVIRDAFGAALFGRPVRINGTNCDVEYVTEEDFVLDDANGAVLSNYPLHAMYFVQVSKLAVVLRDITSKRFAAVIPPRAVGQASLNEWRSMVPPDLDWDTKTASRNIFVATLSMLYDNHIIFLNLQKPFPRSQLSDTDDGDGVAEGQASPLISKATQEAAERIIDLAGTMVFKRSLSGMPHEIFTGIFMAQAVSYKSVSSSLDPTLAKLGRAQVNACQMIFNDVRDFWDPAMWVMQLFNSLLSKGEEEESKKVEHQDNIAVLDDLMTFELFNDLDIFLGDINCPLIDAE